MRLRRGKALIALVLGTLLAAPEGSPGTEIPGDIAARFPVGASLFLGAPGAGHITDALDFYTLRIAENAGDPVSSWIASFREKTGVDLGDPGALKKTGIDTGKPLAVGRYGDPGSPAYLAVIPVTTGRRFPFTFAKLLKKASGQRNLDLDPAVSRYGTHAVFQVMKDIFFAADRSHFMIASSGDLLRKALDLSEGKKAFPSMKDDSAFRGVTSRLGAGDAIVLYAGNGLPWEGMGKKTVKDAPQGGSGIVRASGLALKATGHVFTARLVASLDPSRKETAPFLAALGSDSSARFAGGRPPAFFLHLAMDLEKLAGPHNDGEPGSAPCPMIHGVLNVFDGYFHLDFSRDLLPLAGRAASFMAGKNAGTDEFILYLSKKNGVDTGELRRNLFRKVREKNEGTEGGETSGGIDTLKVTNERGGEAYYAVNDRGVFISNRSTLLERETASGGIGIGDLGGTAGKTFLVAGLDAARESVIKTTIQLALFNTDRRLYRFVEGSGMITVSGARDGNDVIIDVTAATAGNDEGRRQR